MAAQKEDENDCIVEQSVLRAMGAIEPDDIIGGTLSRQWLMMT